MPDGTIASAHVTNTCIPAGERPNKTPIFISGVRDTRDFLAWLRASCPGGLTAQLKAEKLMVVPSTANGFRAAVSALRSLDGGEGVSFHTFTLPEDRCARLLVKNLGRGKPESVVREELESLDIRVQGVTQLSSGRRDQDPAKDRPLTPHFIVSVARGPEVSKVRSINELCGLRVSVETYVAPKGPMQCKRWQHFDTRSVTVDTCPGVSHVVAPTTPVGALPRGSSHSAVAARATTRRTTGAVLSGKKRRQPLQSNRPSVSERAPPQASPPLRKLSGPGPLPSRWTWARSGITSSEGGVLSRPPPLHPQTSIQNPLLNRPRKCPGSLK